MPGSTMRASSTVGVAIFSTDGLSMADGLERFCMRPRKRCSNRHYRSPVPLAAQYGGSRKASELWSGIRRRAGPAVTQLTEPPLYRRQRRNANLVRYKLRFPSVGRGRQRRADAGVVTVLFQDSRVAIQAGRTFCARAGLSTCCCRSASFSGLVLQKPTRCT